MSRFGLGLTGAMAGFAGNDSFTKILLHMDGVNGGATIADSNLGGAAHTWTATSATTDTAAAKFGTTGLNCGAAVGYATTPDHVDYTLGSGDWTVDFWFNRQGGSATNRRAFGQMDSAGTTFSFVGFLQTNDRFALQVQSGGSNPIVSGTTAITAAGWHHFAGVRNGSVLKMFIDGVQEGGNVAIAGSVTDSADVFAVGRSGASSAVPWNGYIDEFRLSVGIARWTANFTPPANPYS